MDVGLHAIAVFVILVAIAPFSISQQELKCKARSGCHFSGCDPVQSLSFAILDRNEFPITCETSETPEVKRLTRDNKKLRKDFSKFVAETGERFKNLEAKINLLSNNKPTVSTAFWSTTSASTTPNEAWYPTRFQCNFNEPSNVCGMRNVAFQKTNWKQHFGKPPENLKGRDQLPIADGDGYIYTIQKVPKSGSDSGFSVIDVPRLGPGSYCVKFRVLMPNAKENTVGVNAIGYSSTHNYVSVLFATEMETIRKGNSWITYEVYFKSSDVDMSVKFEFTNGGFPDVDTFVIVDDITIEPGQCPRN